MRVRTFLNASTKQVNYLTVELLRSSKNRYPLPGLQPNGKYKGSFTRTKAESKGSESFIKIK